MSMFVYSLRRLLAMIPLIIGISMMTYALFAFMPVDPVSAFVGLDRYADTRREALRVEWGLDKPVYQRYLDWAIPMFTELDFGVSWHSGDPVLEDILPFIEKTVLLFGIAFLVTIMVSTITGIMSAIYHNSALDQAALFGTLIGFSLPSFVLGLIIIIAIMVITNNRVVAIYDGTIHKNLGDYIHVVIAATLTIVIGGTAFLTRLVRSQMLDVLRQNYIKTARAKGLPERVVIYKHALRNALLPFVTVIALSLPGILGGSAIIEIVFNYPGVGRRIVRAAIQFDFPIILASNMFFGFMSILMLLVAEIIYGVVDPRIKF
ncbi:MAG: ABC transporter permease [Candidatus Heimdallarchaeota archaeon]|nr:ABC transporter permease [Candidatus Heimdallarchaeota archaeon]